jgi:hypothetical protein
MGAPPPPSLLRRQYTTATYPLHSLCVYESQSYLPTYLPGYLGSHSLSI